VNEIEVRHDACSAIVRRHDPDRYFCVLLAPGMVRDALLALHAFELELARIPERVSEPMMGAIRLQWWREALEGIAAGRPRRHEIVLPLARAIGQGLDPAPLHRMIDAWDEAVAREEPADMVATERHIAGTRGQANLAALRLLQGGPAEGDEALADHAALASGLAAMLLDGARRASEGRPVLPRDIVQRHGLDMGSMLDPRGAARLATATAEVVSAALHHVAALRRATPPRRALPALLPAAFAEADVLGLSRRGNDLFDPSLQHRGIGRQLRVLVRALRGRL
jgi:NADH dehydrogenase [ubiquinone] 1 alpha subcomplex assembly factor 6